MKGTLLPIHIHTHVLGMLPENILFNGIGTKYEKNVINKKSLWSICFCSFSVYAFWLPVRITGIKKL
jgi:hypothetical protein